MPGINGGLLPRPAPAPGVGQGTNAAVLTMGIEDYDATHAKILAAGGRVALPKYALPGMAWQGYTSTPRATPSASTSPTRPPLSRAGASKGRYAAFARVKGQVCRVRTV